MNRGLYDMVAERLAADASMGPEVARLVRAACAGGRSLADALADAEQVAEAPAGEASLTGGRALSLRRVVVTGFRGVGAPVTLELDPGPGLTLVAGRNGSGKSSLAEALEVLLYGDLARWEGRSQDWKKGWANIHTEGPVSVEAELLVEGSTEPFVLRREWAERAQRPSAGEVTARRGEEPADPKEVLDATRLELYRPILSYGDLGRRLESKPSELFDQVAGMLGLDELTAAWRRLENERRPRKTRYEALCKTTEALVARLEALDDPRALEVLDALKSEPWALDTIREVAQGRGAATEALGPLRHVAGLAIPSAEEWDALADDLERALEAQGALAGTEAGQSLELVRLLSQALSHHAHVGDGEACPVCESEVRLDAAWRARAEARVAEAKAAAKAAKEAEAEVEEARSALADRCRFLDPEDVALAETLGLSAAGREAWARWWREEEVPPEALLAHLREHAEAALAVAREARDLAAAELARRSDLWSGVAADLDEWLVHARRSLLQDDEGTIGRLQLAETWLREAENTLRELRFQPIAEQARALWEQMRQDSNVSLESVSLAAKGGNHRRLELAAGVDAMGGSHSALGLMSQGELNVLALSLFLPRVLLDETPYRFVVLDDPVQSMDPHKVDGLARVLDQVAKRRQVIVFTHDPRLLEAVDRLGVEATVLQVVRQARSTLEVHVKGSPIQAYIDQAFRMLEPETADAIGDEQLRCVVPSACRMALEAALQKVARRRLLGAGESHAAAEQKLTKVKATIGLAALALFGDAKRGQEVEAALEAQFGECAGAYRAAVKGAHHPAPEGPDGLKGLVHQTRELAARIEALA